MAIVIIQSNYFSDSPRRTNISLSKDNNVKVGQDLDISCLTDAEPFPQRFSWYRYKNKTQVDSQLWRSAHKSTTTLKEVQRSDEACYICNATNAIGTGEKSKPKCIVVHCKYFSYRGQCFMICITHACLHQKHQFRYNLIWSS